MSKLSIRSESNLGLFSSNESVPARHPILIAEGWESRFVAGGPRLREFTELYKQLGYEVLVEPVGEAELPDACRGCQAAATQFMTIYTQME